MKTYNIYLTATFEVKAVGFGDVNEQAEEIMQILKASVRDTPYKSWFDYVEFEEVEESE